MPLEFEWDHDKAAENLATHGISFRQAALAFADPFSIEAVDDRVDYGEDRFVHIGIAQRQVLTVVYTERRERIRIISARRANKDEQENYYRQTNF